MLKTAKTRLNPNIKLIVRAIGRGLLILYPEGVSPSLPSASVPVMGELPIMHK
uniref:Uncharacterized protein n=1 Tax=uncultured bacterium contig00043 TaxID=1181530 RepID=A0A806JZH1_9BACT|nr:hypothetical protein [uncultured bacterium contig00043]